MSSIENLKEQARRHEQKEEWQKALELYRRAIDRLAEDEQPDIGLYNRVGDLQIRIGNFEDAAGAYEQAVDLYIESELPNNAIAVCKKIVRNMPHRSRAYLRIGQIRAQQGFLVDARQNFLTYAERMQAAGDIDEAFRALGEFAELAPEDLDIREAIARQLLQHDREDEAFEHLAEGYRTAVETGTGEQAAAFEARLRELDPDVDLDDLARPALEPALAFETTSLSSDGEIGGDFGDIRLGNDEESEETEGAVASPAEPTFEGRFAADEEEVETVELQGFEPTAVPGAGLGTTEPHAPVGAEEDEEDEDEDALEVGGLALESDLALAGGEEDLWSGAEPEEVEPSSDAGPEDEALPTFGFGEEEDEEAGTEGEESPPAFALGVDEKAEEDVEEPLPTFGFGVESEEESPAEPRPDRPAKVHGDALASGRHDRSLSMEEAAEEARADHDDPETGAADALDEARRLAEEGRREEAAERYRDALGALDGAGDLEGAMEAARALVELEPEAVEPRQRLVELAFRKNDEGTLVSAYLELAKTLKRNGQDARARAVYQQVLSLDPEREEARAALAAVGAGSAATTARPVQEVASSEDYVDLGSMILDDEEGEKTTRFVVAYEEPSGDEQADFARMLSQFKAKVAENLEADDVKAHHDLGTAYKEMGLLDEAIEEFQRALRASAHHLPTFELLGQTFMEKGQHDAAVRTLTRALDAPWEVEDELLGIYYYLGRAHEERGNTTSAREFYDRVFSLDINFADVTERLRTLR